MNEAEYDYTLPVRWAGYLLYGETRYTDPEEIALITRWLAVHSPGHCAFVADDDRYYHRHDARDVISCACDCATFTFIED